MGDVADATRTASDLRVDDRALGGEQRRQPVRPSTRRRLRTDHVECTLGVRKRRVAPSTTVHSAALPDSASVTHVRPGRKSAPHTPRKRSYLAATGNTGRSVALAAATPATSSTIFVSVSLLGGICRQRGLLRAGISPPLAPVGPVNRVRIAELPAPDVSAELDPLSSGIVGKTLLVVGVAGHSVTVTQHRREVGDPPRLLRRCIRRRFQETFQKIQDSWIRPGWKVSSESEVRAHQTGTRCGRLGTEGRSIGSRRRGRCD